MRNFKLSFVVLLTLIPLTLFSQIVFDPPFNRNNPTEFPDTQVGEESFINVMVSNQGNVQASVRFQGPNAPFVGNPNRIDLQGGGVANFILTFAPEEAGRFESEITITVAIQNRLQRLGPFGMIGNGMEENFEEADIWIDPDEVVVIVQDEEDDAIGRLAIGNRGEGDLTINLSIVDNEWLDLEPIELLMQPGDEARIEFDFSDDLDDNGEYEAIILIESNDPDTPEIEVPIRLTVDLPEIVDMTIELREGWSLISSNLNFLEDVFNEDGPDIEMIISDIVDDIIIIKDGDGRFCSPEWDFWSIPFWNSEDGYQVKTSAETELVIEGIRIPFDRRLELNVNWNVIAYYPNYELRMSEAFSELVENDLLLLAKNGNGEFYRPDFGFEPMSPIEPGEGIMVKLSEAGSFSYSPEPQDERVGNSAINPVSARHYPLSVNTGSNMSLLIRIENSDNLKSGDEIGCYTEDGKLVGSVQLNHTEMVGLAVWGDDKTTDAIDGALEDESIALKLWDGVNEKSPIIKSTIGQMKYQSNELLIVDMDVTQASPTGFGLIATHPNPFNSMVSINYGINNTTHTRLAVYDIEGRELNVLHDKLSSAGSHTVVWDGNAVASGIYILRLESEGVSSSRKIALMR